MMSMIRLQIGSIVPEAGGEQLAEIPAVLERKALLVYAGTFQSMDGQVEVQDEHIERLAGNHNTLLKKLMTGLAGELPLKFCPPIQLDHSLSAKDTVGRLTGLVEVGEHSEDGQIKKALYGKIKIMGRENVEKVLDGRWTHLSIGADLDEGKFQEVTITPFPAAANASMLSKTALMSDREKYHEMVKAYTKGDSKRAKDLAQQIRNSKELDDERLKDVEHILKRTGAKLSQAEYRSLFENAVNSVPGVRPTKVDVSESGAMAYYGDEERAKTAAAALKKTEGIASVEVKPEAENLWCVECKFKEVDGVKLAREKDLKINGKVVTGVLMAGGFGAKVYHVSGGVAVQKGSSTKYLPEGSDDFDIVLQFVNLKYQPLSQQQEIIEKFKKFLTSRLMKGEVMFEKLKAYMVRFMKMSAEDAEKKLAEMPDEDQKKLMTEAEAAQAKRDRMKGYLMAEKGMDDESAEKHLTEVSQEDLKKLEAEVEEHEKLASEDESKEKLSTDESTEGDKAKMRAEVADKIAKLSQGMGTRLAGIKLAAKESKITARLSGLKASMKITPAEIKKIDVKRLAKENNATVEAVLQSYESREPVIITGMMGSTNNVNMAAAHKEQLTRQIEKDIMSSMPFTSRLRKATFQEGEQEGASDKVEIHVDTDPHTDLMGEYDELCKMMDEGKLDEVKQRLKKRYMGGASSYGAAMQEDAGAALERMSMLEQELITLQNEYEEMTKLTASMRE